MKQLLYLVIHVSTYFVDNLPYLLYLSLSLCYFVTDFNSCSFHSSPLFLIGILNILKKSFVCVIEWTPYADVWNFYSDLAEAAGNHRVGRSLKRLAIAPSAAAASSSSSSLSTPSSGSSQLVTTTNKRQTGSVDIGGALRDVMMKQIGVCIKHYILCCADNNNIQFF